MRHPPSYKVEYMCVCVCVSVCVCVCVRGAGCHLDEGGDADVGVLALILRQAIPRFLTHVRHKDLDHVLDVQLEARRETLVSSHLTQTQETSR